MLIFLHKNLLRIVPALEQNANYRRAFESLALARREGNHIVTGDVEVLKLLKAAPHISKDTQSIYSKILEELPQVASLVGSVSVYGIVVPALNEVHDRNGIEMPISDFKSIESVTRARLVAEDLEDCKFYKLIGSTFVQGHMRSFLPISCDFVPGGGSRTAKIYRYCKLKNGVTVAIADSDKLCPDDALGTVAKAIQRVDRKTSGFGEVYVIKCKGVENILPAMLIERAMNEGWSPGSGAINVLDFIKESGEVRLYTDLKNGIRRFDIEEWNAESPRYKFWISRYKCIQQKFGTQKERCAKTKCCYGSSECECWIVTPLGSGALEQVVSASEKVKPRNIWASLDDELKNEWHSIGQLVFSWCCGLPIMSAT